MPSSVSGGGSSSRDNSCNNSSNSMSNSQRSSNVNSSTSNLSSSTKSSQSQAAQSRGNLAGVNVSKNTSAPAESPTTQAAKCNPSQTARAGNLGGVNVSKGTSTPSESPTQASRCNPSQSAVQSANTNKTNLGGLSISKANTTAESPVSASQEQAKTAANSTAKATEAAKAQTAASEAANATASTTPNAAAINATPATQVHTVKKGETLSGIAAKAGTKVKDIVAANPEITNPNKIQIGQKINVPNAQAVTQAVTQAIAQAKAKPTATTPEPATTPSPAEVEAIAAKLPANAVKGLTAEQLKAIVPNLPAAKVKEYLPHLNAALAEFNINTPLRQAAFVAQLAHESVGLTAFQEFASGKAYEGRKDLGNVVAGDGVRYKGRGPIQLTGRANYREVGKALGVDLENNPKLASSPEVGFRVAGHFFESRGLNRLADQQKFDSITKRVNGGFNGKADRDRYYERAKDVLGV